MWVLYLVSKASRRSETQACDCIRDRLWVRFSLKKIKYLLIKRIYSFPLYSIRIPPLKIQLLQNSAEDGERCLAKTRFPGSLPTELCAWYSVNLRKKHILHTHIYINIYIYISIQFIFVTLLYTLYIYRDTIIYYYWRSFCK